MIRNNGKREVWVTPGDDARRTPTHTRSHTHTAPAPRGHTQWGEAAQQAFTKFRANIYKN